MFDEDKIKRYYELREIIDNDSLDISAQDINEYIKLCRDLMYNILVENKDVLERLKND